MRLSIHIHHQAASGPDLAAVRMHKSLFYYTLRQITYNGVILYCFYIYPLLKVINGINNTTNIKLSKRNHLHSTPKCNITKDI